MALDIFKKKEAPPVAPAPPMVPAVPAAPTVPPAAILAGTPTDYVLSLQQQGLTQNQIIQTLQRQGYSQAQISDAMNQAAVKGQVTGGEAPIAGPPPQGPSILPPEGTQFEEIAESIIQEKWEDFQKQLEKESTWKEKTESRIGVVEGQLGELRGIIDNLHKAIVSKIADYDKNLLSVGTEIKAMEKVFQQILPTLTDNVQELSRLTKGMKKKK